MDGGVLLSPLLLRRDSRMGLPETVTVELPTVNNKFSMTWTSDSGQKKCIPAAAPDRSRKLSPQVTPLNLDKTPNGKKLVDEEADIPDDPKTPTRPQPKRSPSIPTSSSHPPLPRAFSMPLPSNLENPHRKGSPSIPSLETHTPPELKQFRELALELADSVQMVIQTLIQIAPQQVLDPAKEQVSAFALSVPTPSISAMFTAMKNINYISANMETFASSGALDENAPDSSSKGQHAFDIGELLQSAGDALSGAAASAQVELVLYHGDVDLKHLWVKGDESGISYALLHIVRQVLGSSSPGDSIEIGLLVSSDLSRGHTSQPPSPSPKAHRNDHIVASPIDIEFPLHCTFEITHNFTSSSDPTPVRPSPSFSIPLLPRLLSKVGAKLETRIPNGKPRRTFELSFHIPRVTSPVVSPPPSDGKPSGEPSVERLRRFSEELRGKKAILYASSRGAFAHHLTSYLASWGMDVSHISDGMPDGQDAVVSPISPSKEQGTDEEKAEVTTSPPQPRLPAPVRTSFIFIDDDVAVLNERMRTLRREATPFSFTRPPTLHRALSTSKVARSTGVPISDLSNTSPQAVIVHFTSLSNFKTVKAVVHSILSSHSGVFPEIMIIPKPAGPRRLLTALHTALTRPSVDTSFSPIVTSPVTPAMNNNNSFFPAQGSPGNTPNKPLPVVHRPSGSRSNSDRSIRSIHEVLENSSRISSSPLVTADGQIEYFTPTTVPIDDKNRIGPNRTAGVMIEVTDRPQGLWFQIDRVPKANPATYAMTKGISRIRSSSTSPAEFLRPTKKRVPSNSSSGPGSPVTESQELKKMPNVVPPISVLIVEDNPINQTILLTFMRRNKIQYDVANDGKTAVEKWKTGNFSLILMDIQMPIMDGKEAARHIRALERAREKEKEAQALQNPNSMPDTPPGEAPQSPYRPHVIILALTAYSWEDERVAALAAGCDDFLTKPISMKWLNRKLVEWGSMQALRMWGAPDAVPPLMSVAAKALQNQAAKALNVAGSLKLPKGRNSRTPSPRRTMAPPPVHDTGVSGPVSAGPSSAMISSTSSAFWSDNPDTPFTPPRAALESSHRSDDSTPKPEVRPNGRSHDGDVVRSSKEELPPPRTQ